MDRSLLERVRWGLDDFLEAFLGDNALWGVFGIIMTTLQGICAGITAVALATVLDHYTPQGTWKWAWVARWQWGIYFVGISSAFVSVYRAERR